MIWPHSRGFLQWKENICVFTWTFSWLIRPAAVKKLQGKVSWHGAKAATLQKGQGLQRQVHQLHVCQQDQVVLCFCGRWHAERFNQSLILYTDENRSTASVLNMISKIRTVAPRVSHTSKPLSGLLLCFSVVLVNSGDADEPSWGLRKKINEHQTALLKWDMMRNSTGWNNVTNVKWKSLNTWWQHRSWLLMPASDLVVVEEL